MVKCSKLISFTLRTAPSYRANIDQAITKFNKGAPLNRKDKFWHVTQGIVDECLKFFLSNMFLNILKLILTIVIIKKLQRSKAEC